MTKKIPNIEFEELGFIRQIKKAKIKFQVYMIV